MFNIRKEQFDHRQGSMIDGRTVSRLAPAPGSPQLRVDLVQQPDVALNSVKVTRTSPLLSASTRKTSLLYELEVNTAQGVYYIDRTFEELADLHTKLKDLPSLRKVKTVRGTLKKPEPKNLSKNTRQWNERFEAFVKQANQAAVLRSLLAPRSTAHHMLFVDILEARNLLATDMNGFSDPFIRVSMVDLLGQVIGEPVQTSIVHKSLNPVWNEQVVFDLNQSVAAVTLSCWDKDRFSRNDFMGRITLKTSDIPNNTEVRRWFPLHSTKARHSDVHGEVLLRIHYKTPLPGGLKLDAKTNEEINDEAIAACKAERDRRRRKLEKRRFAGELHLTTLYNPPLGNWGGYLTITVVGARSLLAKDSGGTSDPYVVLSLNGRRFRTRKISHSLEPTWNETFYYHIPAKSVEGLVMEVDVYDWDVVGRPDAIGDTCIHVDELAEGFSDLQLKLVAPPPTQDSLDKKIGKRMAEEGWTPKLPIVLVPGFGSTSLEVVEGYEKWKGERVWLSLSKISRQALSFRRFKQARATRRLSGRVTATGDFESIPQVEDEEEWEEALMSRLGTIGASISSLADAVVVDPAVELAFKNRWIQHLCLQEDGISDPEGIKVRPVKGVEAVTYLDPGALTAPLSYVMGPLVENLQQLGYVYGDNLLAAGYDWRLPLHHLEERDGYFTQLKRDIEDMAARTHSPVVLMGHSMGNRVIQYFLNWIVHTDPAHGRKWISDNVHTFMAVGAPWLGASKAVRGLATGEKFGLDAFLTDLEAITFGHRISSTACLLPVGCEKTHHHLPASLESFAHFNDGSDVSSKPVPYRDLLANEAGAHGPSRFYEEYMRKNPLYGGEHKDEFILKAPPVDRLYAIYGTNLETEVAYIFKQDDGLVTLDDALSKAQRSQLESEGYVVKKGIVWETARTRQGIVRELTGVDAHTSGDGTVTYASLNHCARWRNEIPKLKIEELDGAEHRQILANRLFFKTLIEYVAERNIIGNHVDLGALATRLRIRSEELFGLDDINDGEDVVPSDASSPPTPKP